MKISSKSIDTKGIKFYVLKNKQEVARAYLYLLFNDLHKEPFGFMEDVFVDESLRGKGIGTKLVKKVIQEAKKRKCYKLICTSRYQKQKVHELYKHLGFKDQGKEFRIDFIQ